MRRLGRGVGNCVRHKEIPFVCVGFFILCVSLYIYLFRTVDCILIGLVSVFVTCQVYDPRHVCLGV